MKLVINKKFFRTIEEKHQDILSEFGYSNTTSFFEGVIEKLNDEYDFLNITSIRFQTQEESRKHKQYGAFIEGNFRLYEKVIIFFTPLSHKLGNTNINQELMPTILQYMKEETTFLLNNDYKKVCLLTSQFNKKNNIGTDYNTLQMNINSLNTMGFDVIPFFNVTNLSTDSKFESLLEFLEMSEFLQQKNAANDQTNYLILKEDTLYGNCLKSQIKGNFVKWYVFKYLTAIFAGGNNYNYDISKVIQHSPKDSQLKNLQNFVDYVNKHKLEHIDPFEILDDDYIVKDDAIFDFDDIHRAPTKTPNKYGRKRYDTQRKIRDEAIKRNSYLCDCHDNKHFYFESSDMINNYVEGHHLIPMNRQGEYWQDHNINLDVVSNILALCPTCHKQIHLGSRKARLDILSEVYVRNEIQLKKVDSNLAFKQLASFYNIGLEEEEEKYLIQRAKAIVENKRI